MKLPVISAADVEPFLSWDAICDAIQKGHHRPRAKLGDQFLREGDNTLLSRCAWIDGLGVGVKSVTVMPGNPGNNMPSVQGAMLIFDDLSGTPRALIDSDLVTKWKTAGDSALGAKLLANPDPKILLIVGAGTVGSNLIEAYCAVFPGIETVRIWSRTTSSAQSLAGKFAAISKKIEVFSNLAAACEGADVISTATMSNEPVLRGEWVSPGTHVDLIGAFKPDMREADDSLLQKSSIFVDSFETTIDHIGELKIPLASGAIEPHQVLADFYDLVSGHPGRQAKEEITVFKNGGGAHLDLMVADVILQAAG